MTSVKSPFVLEPKENLVLTLVCEESSIEDVEKDPIRGGIAAVWEVSVYKLIKKHEEIRNR
jgi:hypothetical protein